MMLSTHLSKGFAPHDKSSQVSSQVGGISRAPVWGANPSFYFCLYNIMYQNLEGRCTQLHCTLIVCRQPASTPESTAFHTYPLEHTNPLHVVVVVVVFILIRKPNGQICPMKRWRMQIESSNK